MEVTEEVRQHIEESTKKVVAEFFNATDTNYTNWEYDELKRLVSNGMADLITSLEVRQ